MFAVMGTWRMDPDLREQASVVLRERVVPGVRQFPGVVKGYWAGDPSSDRSFTYIVCESRAAADAFAADVRGNADNQSRMGITLEELLILYVTAET